jgi:hypothetical protein
VFSTPVKKRTPHPSLPPKRPSVPLFLKGAIPLKGGRPSLTKKMFYSNFFLENDQVILSTSKCFKMTPYAMKIHLESIKFQ